jgi:hypothetical protein
MLSAIDLAVAVLVEVQGDSMLARSRSSAELLQVELYVE